MTRFLHRLLPIVFFAALLDPSYAASAAIEIKAPLPEVLRERVAAMLRTVRPKDVAAALDAT
ncbi:MAG: hypothetical protein WAP03_17575 [Methylorubrum rhodinum]|uniref:hypothetical protein n=1 Tax=Methylorubrum rhodinum TaxID=29428 RepID=UPI003BB214D0